MKLKSLLLTSVFIIFFGVFGLVKVNSAQAQTCTAPAVATGVTVDYPGCNGSQCDLTQASCSWTSQGDASSYNVTVTEVETNTVIKNNESQTASTTKILFPITQKRTYKCDVVAVSSCGGLAAAASDQLLCEADAIIDTPTPAPTSVAVPTATPVPPTAVPTIAKPGGPTQTLVLLGGIMIALVGGVILFVL